MTYEIKREKRGVNTYCESINKIHTIDISFHSTLPLRNGSLRLPFCSLRAFKCFLLPIIFFALLTYTSDWFKEQININCVRLFIANRKNSAKTSKIEAYRSPKNKFNNFSNKQILWNFFMSSQPDARKISIKYFISDTTKHHIT